MATFTYLFNDPVLTINMTGGTWGSYYRFFVRYANDASSVVYQKDYYCPSSGTLSVPITLDPGNSYRFNAGETSNGATTWYWGTAPMVTTASAAVRPNNWQWWSTIRKSYEIRISANEWNAFCDRINDFRDYVGLSYRNFATVYSGTKISASIVNQARSAIADMTSRAPHAVYAGDTITADFFLDLGDALNSVS